MGEFSLTHILLLLVIVLVLFGPSRLPSLGKSMGEAIRGFKKGLESQPDPQAGQPAQHTPPPQAARFPELGSPSSPSASEAYHHRAPHREQS